MGLDLTYQAGERAFRIRFSMADWQTIDALREHLPHAISTCFEVKEFGEPVSVAAAAMRESVEQIATLLAQRPELLPYTYQFKAEYLQLGDQRIVFDRFDTGGHCGFQLPGDMEHHYTIWGGLNELRLEKIAVRPDGTGEVVEVRDLRGERELMTTNSGLVRFRKRRAKTSLRKGLAEMRDFLAAVGNRDVAKTLG